MQFADHTFMLHHGLQNLERNAVGAISSDFTAVNENAARKVHYSKSSHQRPLATLLHSNKGVYGRRAIEELFTALLSSDGDI